MGLDTSCGGLVGPAAVVEGEDLGVAAAGGDGAEHVRIDVRGAAGRDRRGRPRQRGRAADAAERAARAAASSTRVTRRRRSPPRCQPRWRARSPWPAPRRRRAAAAGGSGPNAGAAGSRPQGRWSPRPGSQARATEFEAGVAASGSVTTGRSRQLRYGPHSAGHAAATANVSIRPGNPVLMTRDCPNVADTELSGTAPNVRVMSFS